MTWTTPADIKGQLRRLWDKGIILAALASGEEIFPRRLTLKAPKSSEMAERFSEVRAWIASLDGDGEHYRVVRREIHHRTLGVNAVPAEVWIDSLADCLSLIGKGREADRFASVVEKTANRYSQLIPWLIKRPMQGLALAGDWPRLLDIVSWMHDHPRPGIYLRQVDIPGVHSKFIEGHRAVLAELFDLALPSDSINAGIRGAAGFCRRYGFRDKPGRVRFRLLDPSLSLMAGITVGETDQDFTVSEETFAQLDPPVQRIYITENEINFLAFPQVPKSMVIFGAGYGFGIFAEAVWLHARTLHYWGDIDTHGFAILDQLRSLFPAAKSLLMDRETLLTHRPHWDHEPQPNRAELCRLTPEEHLLYDDLRLDRLAPQLRLEQERLGFSWVEKGVGQTLG